MDKNKRLCLITAAISTGLLSSTVFGNTVQVNFEGSVTAFSAVERVDNGSVEVGSRFTGNATISSELWIEFPSESQYLIDSYEVVVGDYHFVHDMNRPRVRIADGEAAAGEIDVIWLATEFDRMLEMNVQTRATFVDRTGASLTSHEFGSLSSLTEIAFPERDLLVRGLERICLEPFPFDPSCKPDDDFRLEGVIDSVSTSVPESGLNAFYVLPVTCFCIVLRKPKRGARS